MKDFLPNLVQGFYDVLALARMVEGEGCELFGKRRNDVARVLCGVALRRWVYGADVCPAWRAPLDRIVEDGFRGAQSVQIPEPWAVRVAMDEYIACVLFRRFSVPEGVYYVVSGAEVREHGWQNRLTFAVIVFEGQRGAKKFFFRQWPDGGPV